MSTNEISGSNELCAQDPEDMTFYNLRGSDKTTILRKKELQRLRKEHIENKCFRKKEKIRKAKEIVDSALKIREELHQKYLRAEPWLKEQERQRLERNKRFTSKNFTLTLASSSYSYCHLKGCAFLPLLLT